jgi:hypothetical protein
MAVARDAADIVPARLASRPWWPALKWAAAALVLGLGFALTPDFAERRRIGRAQNVRGAAYWSDATRTRRGAQQQCEYATAAANAETLRLFADYSQLQESQRASDQQNLGVALRSFETRLGRLRAELETVALNTENGFEQTHENFSRLASFSARSRTTIDF